jgi:death-on-curing protein
VIEPEWLEEETILAAHHLQIATFGGSPGIRDIGLLRSAMARPCNLLAYDKPSLTDLAAAYAFGIVRNHPFIDGNKRVALVAIVSFLDINGQQLIADEPSAKLTIESLAASEIDEAALAEWVAANVEPLK